jgi:exopolyphosphatase/pppGpp-phosphohydrolase
MPDTMKTLKVALMVILLQSKAYSTSEIRSAFDIGTGKIKMQVASVNEDHIDPLYCHAEQIPYLDVPIINQEGEITQEGQDSIIEILKSLKLAGESYGSKKCDAVATELFRTAKNGREIAENISSLLNMEIKIISPEEEGILSFLTIVQEKNLNPEDIVVLDIGSGSFQITCKEGDRFLVYSAPFGRIPTHALVKNNQLSILELALSNINPRILRKIRDCKNHVIGIGAHPKHILKAQTIYDENNLKAALLANAELDIDHTDLLLVKTIMESLSITQVNYKPSYAGNTSGIFLISRSYKP